jgi:uncharacterized membrane protein (DUF441 family)
MSQVYRQEVFNVLLAQLLQERGVISAPESILTIGLEEHRRMPDVLVNFNGLRTIIEGELGSRVGAHDRALASATKRVEEGIAHIGIAVVYPVFEGEMEFVTLKEQLIKAEMEISVITESRVSGFVKGNVDYLENALRMAFEELVREDIVAQAVAELDGGIERFAAAIVRQRGVIIRMSKTLGIHELPSAKKDEPREDDDD